MAETCSTNRNGGAIAPAESASTGSASTGSWIGSLIARRRKIATGAAGLLAAGLAYHVVFGANGLTVYQQKRQETQALSEQLQHLQHESDLLKGHVDRLQTDPDAIEHQAREELHYTRPGEVIYTLPSAPTGTAKVAQ
jgi:cell division protein FtsB